MSYFLRGSGASGWSSTSYDDAPGDAGAYVTSGGTTGKARLVAELVSSLPIGSLLRRLRRRSLNRSEHRFVPGQALVQGLHHIEHQRSLPECPCPCHCPECARKVRTDPEHSSRLDDGHVERGETHQYGYELPSPRQAQSYQDGYEAGFADGNDAGAFVFFQLHRPAQEQGRMRVFDNSRWGAMNSKQRAVLGMLDHLTDWDKKWIAQIAVTYAYDEVQAALIDGGESGE